MTTPIEDTSAAPSKKDQLTELLKSLGRGRLDAAEQIAELLLPEAKTVTVELPPAPKKKAR